MKYDAETIRGILQLNDLGTPEEIALALAKKCGKKPEMESALQDWKSQGGIFRRNGAIEDVIEKVLSRDREDNQTIVRYPYIEDFSDRYRLHNVPYLTGVSVIDWSKELLDQGRRHNQNEWLDFSKNQEFQLPSMLDYTATVQVLHQHRKGAQEKLVDKIKSLLQKDMQDSRMATSTRIHYTPFSPDKIMHGYGTSRGISFEANLVGPDLEGFKDISDSELKSLFGVSDADKITQAHKWFSGKNSYFFRTNSRPKVLTEKAVWLDISTDRFYLYCGNNPILNNGRARGVRVESSA